MAPAWAVAEAVRNIAAGAHNRRALPVEAERVEELTEVRVEANTAARSLILGWGWGKWTFDL
jgi:hypothetical protein